MTIVHMMITKDFQCTHIEPGREHAILGAYLLASYGAWFRGDLILLNTTETYWSPIGSEQVPIDIKAAALLMGF